MRKLIVTEFISVDGIAEVEKLPGVTWNDEMKRFKEDELADSGAMLLGRTTYEIFAGSWPRETGDFADRFNALPKYVASTSLKALDWKPAELLKRLIIGSGQGTEARQRRQHLCAWQPQRGAGIAAPRPGRPRQAA